MDIYNKKDQDKVIPPDCKDLKLEIGHLKDILEEERTKRAQIEKELNKTKSKLINAQEEERKRLSRNLHDGIGQNLYSHLISINLLKSQIKSPLIDQIEKETTDLIEIVRTISWELRPSVLDDLGLIPAIRTYLGRYSEHYGIDVAFEYALSQRISPEKEIAIYRIIQEALTNTSKYANTNKASIIIRETSDSVRVLIEDKGKGFVLNKTSFGVGISSMIERAQAVNGELFIDSSPGKGVKIIIDIPL